MTWQQRFLETLGTGGLGGMSFACWWQHLRANGFSVDLPYWPRAATTTISCLQNSMFRRIESHRFGKALQRVRVHPPVFILGLWRSGTTHLHNLMAQDHRLAYPNTYQVFFPHSFLTTEHWHSRLLAGLLPSRRVQDNVALGVDKPQEDDFALAGLTGMSFMMSFAFPRRAAEYSRFMTLKHATHQERQQWCTALDHFLRKLTLKYDKPLVLKSPAHTAHVRELLNLYPDAKFVLIHRHPHEVFTSTLHCFDKVFRMWALQRLGDYDIVESTIRNYRQVLEKYFSERSLIPRGNLIEVSFEELESSPIETLRQIYSTLDLPAFDAVEGTVKAYVDTLQDYQKNQHGTISKTWKKRLARDWQLYFAHFGYHSTGRWNQPVRGDGRRLRAI